MDGLDVAQFAQVVLLAPSGELRRGPGVGLAGVGVTDIGGEELDKALGRLGVRREQRRKVWQRLG